MGFELLLNFSVLFALLIAPSVLVLSLWYRRNLGKPVFVWHKPELVMVTIIFFITSLIMAVVGVTCVFLNFGYLESSHFPAFSKSHFLNIGLSCFLLIAGTGMVYIALRKLLVQLVMEKGVVLNKGIVPLPNALHIIEWNDVADYYVNKDFPNASFTFIVQHKDFNFERHTIKVPMSLTDSFQEYLDRSLYTSGAVPSSSSERSSRNFLEN